jgi:hypothetical protein
MEAKMQNKQIKPDFLQIIKNNHSGYIFRKNLTEQTGGLLHGRTMANLDSMGGIGIPGRISIGRKVAYPVESVVAYLQANVTVNHGAGKERSFEISKQTKGI